MANSLKPARHSAAGLRVERLNTVNLVKDAAEQLQNQITRGYLAAGQALPSEGELSLQLGVSRTVVREAMRILSAKGFVEVSRGKKPRVKQADASQVVDSLSTFLQRANHPLLQLIEVRCQLETSIAALAAERASREQIAAMDETIRQLLEADTIEKQANADLAFHTLLAGATGNPVFHLLLEPMTHLLRQSRLRTLSRTGAERAAEGHRKILDAVRRGKAAAAREAMLDHLTKAGEDLEGVDTKEA